MIKIRKFIKIEGKKYPTVIMGEDVFTGWFKKGKFKTEKQRAKAYKATIEEAYRQGVRGFSISPQKTLMKVLENFKKKHPGIVCIANAHWKNHYYYGGESLWNYLKKINKLHPKKIRLDEKEYKNNLKRFKFCDFWLVGNFGRSALLKLRKDIVEREIELARKTGFIPIGMCEAGDAIGKVKLNVYWTWINKEQAFPNLKSVLKAIKKTKKPITAYKIFSAPIGFDLEDSIKFIKKIKQIKSIVVGVENKEQAKETFSLIFS